MNIFLLPLLASVLAVSAFFLRRRWLQTLVCIGIIFMISYILLFYSGSVARSIMQPGPPKETCEEVFYAGIRNLQDSLLPSYFAVIYLTILGFVTATMLSVRRASTEPVTRNN